MVPTWLVGCFLFFLCNEGSLSFVSKKKKKNLDHMGRLKGGATKNAIGFKETR
jgi:hypothetical protein